MVSRMFHPDAAVVLESLDHGMLYNAGENFFHYNNKGSAGGASLLAQIYPSQYVLLSGRTSEGVKCHQILMDHGVQLPLTMTSSQALRSCRLHTG